MRHPLTMRDPMTMPFPELVKFANDHWDTMTKLPEEQAAEYLSWGRMAAEGIMCALAATPQMNLEAALRRLMMVNHCIGSSAFIYILDREDWMPPLRSIEMFTEAKHATELFTWGAGRAPTAADHG